MRQSSHLTSTRRLSRSQASRSWCRQPLLCHKCCCDCTSERTFSHQRLETQLLWSYHTCACCVRFFLLSHAVDLSSRTSVRAQRWPRVWICSARVCLISLAARARAAAAARSHVSNFDPSLQSGAPCLVHRIDWYSRVLINACAHGYTLPHTHDIHRCRPRLRFRCASAFRAPRCRARAKAHAHIADCVYVGGQDVRAGLPCVATTREAQAAGVAAERAHPRTPFTIMVTSVGSSRV